MKNLVRAFALALVATGAASSVQVGPAMPQNSMSSRASAVPMPTCPPDDPTGCGICQLIKRCNTK